MITTAHLDLAVNSTIHLGIITSHLDLALIITVHLALALTTASHLGAGHDYYGPFCLAMISRVRLFLGVSSTIHLGLAMLTTVH